MVNHGHADRSKAMATFQVTVPDTIAIGRNAEHGTLAIEWDKIPQLVKDHIATVYFPQYITDAANSGGKDSTSADRLALAQKKLQAMLAGEIRTRGDAKEPIDPIEAQAYRDALEVVRAQLLKMPQAKQIPKGTKDRAQWVLDTLDAAAKRQPREVHDVVMATLEANPDIRKEAARKVKKAAELAATINLN
jgi:phage tail protein X